MTNPILLIIGTRAEAIKLIPVYLALKEAGLSLVLCATFQHAELLQQVLDLFNVVPDYNLGIMKPGQDLFYLTSTILEKTKKIYERVNPALVMVHGDTTTTMASALGAFYLHIPIAHVEAGLRTGNMLVPFPEEMNRKVVGQIATYHFAPTALATANLLSEGVPREKVFCTGNPIVDVLKSIKRKIAQGKLAITEKIKQAVASCKEKKCKMVLLTAHRRESFNGGLLRVFTTMKRFANIHNDVHIFYSMHPNPNVRNAVMQSGIRDVANVSVLEALVYPDLVFLLDAVDWVATDSGGLQEEAVSLGKRVLCLRDVTERWEGVWEGIEFLVGTDPDRIMQSMEACYRRKANHLPSSIYGDGHACKRIASILTATLPNLCPEVVKYNKPEKKFSTQRQVG